ncbi:hypothetical protein H920_04059 [Fukomys damarensis]|uniref:Uncharacterized protein n=1 Tax=Fukomys damarensis TaxID=885580 RepID=A0A091DTX6_FUKDA|nr:hypothetical protein H920_04059 [Fukomys damarensis]
MASRAPLAVGGTDSAEEPGIEAATGPNPEPHGRAAWEPGEALGRTASRYPQPGCLLFHTLKICIQSPLEESRGETWVESICCLQTTWSEALKHKEPEPEATALPLSNPGTVQPLTSNVVVSQMLDDDRDAHQ